MVYASAHATLCHWTLAAEHEKKKKKPVTLVQCDQADYWSNLFLVYPCF